jgi:excisionase family DNA binding protein
MSKATPFARPKKLYVPEELAAPSFTSLPKLLDIKACAHVLGISVRTVHTLIKERQLTFFRVRGQLRFDAAHLNEYLTRRMIRRAA